MLLNFLNTRRYKNGLKKCDIMIQNIINKQWTFNKNKKSKKDKDLNFISYIDGHCIKDSLTLVDWDEEEYGNE